MQAMRPCDNAAQRVLFTMRKHMAPVHIVNIARQFCCPDGRDCDNRIKTKPEPQMPHCIVEYSVNLEQDGEIDLLLHKLADHFRTEPTVFPTGGVRIRAVPVHHYVIADGNPDHGFVNVQCRIGAGRPAGVRKAFFSKGFEIVKDHFAALSKQRGIGITFYVDQADPEGSWKTNSIHNFMT